MSDEWGRDLVRDEHLTRLTTWVLNTLGKAVLLAAAVAVLAGLVAGLTQDADFAWLGAAGVPLTFGLVLYNAEGPHRADVREEDQIATE